MGAAKPTRVTRSVVVVDHYPLFRTRLVALINSETDYEVCAQAAGHRGAIEAVASCRPDLVITDLFLGREDGLALVKDIRVALEHLPILVLTVHTVPFWAERSYLAGANGYLSKREIQESLTEAMRTVLDGQRYISPTVRPRLDPRWLP